MTTMSVDERNVSMPRDTLTGEAPTKDRVFRILSLDGGGAKGFYTLGVLKEIEAKVNCLLYKRFDLIYGTSTGAIIAALLALGFEVDEIHDLYKKYVPDIMRARKPRHKSAVLAELGEKVFGARKFDDVKTAVGIVASRWRTERPMIFKGSVAQAHGRAGTFVPGFGVTISDAVQASASAYPFFERKWVKTAPAGDEIELIDGGYCANNPTLYAIADATIPLKIEPDNIRVVSLGVGNYPEPKPGFMMAAAKRFIISVQLAQKTFEINKKSLEQLQAILFKNIYTVRIDDTFETPEMATDIFEHNLSKLNQLRQRGGESFSKREQELSKILL
jgi:predicted patatin/cPLA2 family phospholipase